MYNEKTTKELLEVLGQYRMLTFESQLILNQELVSRNIAIDKSDLEKTIDEKLAQIKNMILFLINLRML